MCVCVRGGLRLDLIFKTEFLCEMVMTMTRGVLVYARYKCANARIWVCVMWVHTRVYIHFYICVCRYVCFWFINAKHEMQMWTDLRVSGFVLLALFLFLVLFLPCLFIGRQECNGILRSECPIIIRNHAFLILKSRLPKITLSLLTSDTCLDFLNKNLEVNM